MSDEKIPKYYPNCPRVDGAKRFVVTKEQLDAENSQLWDALMLDARRARTANYERIYKGKSGCMTIRCGKKYWLTMDSDDTLTVEQYERINTFPPEKRRLSNGEIQALKIKVSPAQRNF